MIKDSAYRIYEKDLESAIEHSEEILEEVLNNLIIELMELFNDKYELIFDSIIIPRFDTNTLWIRFTKDDISVDVTYHDIVKTLNEETYTSMNESATSTYRHKNEVFLNHMYRVGVISKELNSIHELVDKRFSRIKNLLVTKYALNNYSKLV